MAIHVFFRTLIFTILVPGTVGGLVPHLIANSRLDGMLWYKALPSPVTDIAGFILLAIGAAIYLWCAYDFTFIGRGSPAIFDAPSHLVVRGLYHYTRNPMYIGVLTAIIGQGLIYGSPAVLIYVILLFLMFNSFVLFYEEPTLRKKFGEEYVRYCQQVNRWLPTLKER